MILTRKSWSPTPVKPAPGSPRAAWREYAIALAKTTCEPTIGAMFDRSTKLKEVEQYQPDYLPPGTRVRLRDGRRATVTNFVPYDGYNIGVQVDGLPNEGMIITRKDVIA